MKIVFRISFGGTANNLWSILILCVHFLRPLSMWLDQVSDELINIPRWSYLLTLGIVWPLIVAELFAALRAPFRGVAGLSCCGLS